MCLPITTHLNGCVMPALLIQLLQSSVILDQQYQATIAIETDGEYWNLFRDRERALNYIADLIGCELVVHSVRGVGRSMGGWLFRNEGTTPDC